jgi:BirA family biotin operon repressor/biotin-[acetyl-CoA-carboxylase] ligase
VALAADLSAAELARALPDRPVRTYPALLSTEADALAWARSGARSGAVVVADYQASPRGRAGWPWTVEPGRDLAFSLVLRPHLPPDREGWLYTVAASALADVVGGSAAIDWPDEVQADGRSAAAVGVVTEMAADGLAWAVVNVLVRDSRPPRAQALAATVSAIEERARQAPDDVLADYLRRCATIGRSVRAKLVPMGPAGVVVAGRAADVVDDGALVVETGNGRRVAVRPQSLGVLEPDDTA